MFRKLFHDGPGVVVSAQITLVAFLTLPAMSSLGWGPTLPDDLDVVVRASQPVAFELPADFFADADEPAPDAPEDPLAMDAVDEEGDDAEDVEVEEQAEVAEGPPTPEADGEAAEQGVETDIAPTLQNPLFRSGRGGLAKAGAGKGKATGQKARKRRKRCPDNYDGIAKDRFLDQHWRVERSLRDYYTRNLGEFLKLGLARPYNEDGVKGFRIAGLSCKGPIWAAGLRRGDVILTVNGKKTRSWTQLFFLYQKLKKRDSIEVVLMRKGERRTFNYTFTDSV